MYRFPLLCLNNFSSSGRKSNPQRLRAPPLKRFKYLLLLPSVARFKNKKSCLLGYFNMLRIFLVANATFEVLSERRNKNIVENCHKCYLLKKKMKKKMRESSIPWPPLLVRFPYILFAILTSSWTNFQEIEKKHHS